MTRLQNLLGRLLRRDRPKRYRIDDYQRWFPETADVFLRYLKRFDVLPVSNGLGRPAVGVVISPWVSTPVPWYSIMLGIGLARRGRKVVLLWDDIGFPEPRVEEQQRVIAGILAHVGRDLPVVRLSDEPAHPPSETDRPAIEALTNQNVTWRLRGASPAERDLLWVREVEGFLTRTLPLVRSALGRVDMDCLVLPGGVRGSSGLFRLAAEERGCRVSTYDAEVHIVNLCVGGVAAQHADLPRAFDVLWNSEEDSKREAVTTARAEFISRTQGTDRSGYQVHPAGTASSSSVEADAVLMPLNVEWDAAALGRHLHFADTVDWITSTISEILEMSECSVIVRQHPAERRKLQRSRLDIATILQDRFGDEPRCRFIAADEPVSTYDLLASARLVLPFVSTIGIEAAAIGKPVLISGTSYYADLGFVWSASSRHEYFELLRRGVRGDLPLLADQSDRAWICYYLSAVLDRIWTDFTPQPDDFWKWCRRPPDALFGEPEVSDVLEAIDTDVPVALLRHRRTSAVQAR